MSDTLASRYEAMAKSGALTPDASQRALVAALDALLAALAKRRRPETTALRWLAGRRRAPPRGLYVHGGVGGGKTLIMDLFFAAAPEAAKRRVHFHAFMAEVHERIATKRREGLAGDPIAPVAADLTSEISLLCFDEFAVNDIADAMILGRLFGELFARGTVVVATSNIAPDDLYRDGLNRALFLPFIALLKERMAIFHLDAPHDHRLDARGSERRYVTPLGPAADACLDAHFRHLAGVAKGIATDLRRKGRRIAVPQSANGVARFSFNDLCGQPLGAGDYLAIADAFSTLIVSDVPILSATRRNEAKRFIDLIDTLYDRRARLIISAETEPSKLWSGDEGREAFEFARTSSRLVEMQSDSYFENAGTRVPEMKKAQALRPGPLES